MQLKDALFKIESMFKQIADYADFHGCCQPIETHLMNAYEALTQQYMGPYEFVSFDDGSFYWGSRRNGTYSGYGVYYWSSSNSMYVGEFRDGKKHGQGIYYQDGYFYSGGYKDDRCYGHALQRSYPSGVEVEADWDGNTMTRVYPTSDEFVGADGLHYNHANNFNPKGSSNSSNSSDSSSKSDDDNIWTTCLGWVIILAVLGGIFKFCFG